jgi:uncharacterized protein YndB with AHSA1/START domain
MTDNTIRLSRHFPHRVDAVWAALTTPELLARWWAPGDITPTPGTASRWTWGPGASSNAKFLP